MELFLGCIYLLVTWAVIFSMTVLMLQAEKNISNSIYVACHICVAIWCSSQILLLISDTISELRFSYAYGNLGICFAGAFWLLFALCYDYSEKKIKPLWLTPFILCLLHYAINITNGYHHLYYSEFSLEKVTRGPVFYSNMTETYLFIILGAIIFIKKVIKKKKQSGNFSRKGSILIILAVIIPLILNLLYISGIIKSRFDITALGFAISVILVRTATAKYQFFDMKRQLDIASEKLILEKERNRIAQQVHDTTGHTLTMLQSYMKLTEVAVKNDSKEEAFEYITEARSLTSSGIRELRESINQLKAGDNSQLITQGINQLASQVKEIPCEVTIKGEDSENYSHLSLVTYNTVRECITNTLKYAKASRIDIVIKFKNDVIELIVADDGIGTDKIVDNNGLAGIKKRISEVNGTVKFISSDGEGFMTRITLPIK